MSEPLTRFHFRARARAKVNLALEVLGRRRDGFHDIETIMQSVNLFDTLDIAFDRSGTIAITCSDPDIPTGEANICYRAVEHLRPFTTPDLGARIHIDKQIPHSAGLGGGSSDAGAVLLAAQAGTADRLDPMALEGVAAGLGSDVPFMLYGGTMLARGRGEQLVPLTPLQGGFFLIVKPPVDISTRDVYRDVDLSLTRHRYRINLNQVNTLLARFPNVELTFRNALEDIVCPKFPPVAEALGELLASRARFASMSGSGSALFAIYESEARASQLAEHFSVRGFFAAVVEPSSRAVELDPMGR